MKVLEDNINNKDFLSKGIYWCKPRNTTLSERANVFMEKACKNNELSCVIEIDSFEEFLNSIYKNYEHKNPIIDERWNDFDNRKKEINFSSDKTAQSPLKMNTFVSTELPSCNVFETDISKVIYTFGLSKVEDRDSKRIIIALLKKDQREMLELLAKGYTQKEIAEKLKMSQSNVSQKLNSIKKELQDSMIQIMPYIL